MKTKLTRDMERALYGYCRDNDAIAVEEVTLPDDQGIVDTLSYHRQPNGTIEWRCYELKVSKSDFHSQAKLSFIGHYNYFVLAADLYPRVMDEVPSGIGVLVYHPFDPTMLALAVTPPSVPGYFVVAKMPRYQALQVSETALTDRFIKSQAREVGKAKQVATGLQAFSTEKLFTELKRRHQHYDPYHPEENFYDRLIADAQETAISALQEELDAVNTELYLLRHQVNPSAGRLS